MSRDTLFLIDAALSVVDVQDAGQVQGVLGDPQAVLASSEPSREEVEQLLPTLRARLANARDRGTVILGLAQAIRRLEKLPPHDKVLGYGVRSPAGAANVYFTERDQRAVGAMVAAAR